MSASLSERLQAAPVVPLVQADEPEVAVKTALALVEGGLTVIEVVLRTDTALACLSEIKSSVDQAIVGAGTVLSVEQAETAMASGAEFIVSPGFDSAVCKAALREDKAVFPGIYTPSELMQAANLGLETVKFFPASLAGGVPALKALSSVFRHMRFMPTGGISASNLAEYLQLPSVVACGGSWLTPADAISMDDYGRITRLAREALDVAAIARS